MSDLDRVLQWMKEGLLLPPVSAQTGFLDMVRALGQSLGAPLRSQAMGGPVPQHVIFCLLDGFGLNQLSDAHTPFLKQHLSRELRALFPSTTAVVLTALATGAWPARHGIPGWWTYLSPNEVLMPLPYALRGHSEPFSQSIEQVMPLQSWWPRCHRSWLCLQPYHLVGTVYSTYLCGGGIQRGYRDLSDAIDLCASYIQRSHRMRKATATYLYWPRIDSISHRYGPSAKETVALLKEADAELKRLALQLPKSAILFVTADHGQVASELSLWLKADDPLLSLLETPPTGEPSVPIFHVKQGHKQVFLQLFHEQLGRYFALLTPEDCEKLQLFGPEVSSPLLRARLGDFIGIAQQPVGLYVEGIWDGAPHKGIHGGLRSEEMRIPFIVYRNQTPLRAVKSPHMPHKPPIAGGEH